MVHHCCRDALEFAWSKLLQAEGMTLSDVQSLLSLRIQFLRDFHRLKRLKTHSIDTEFTRVSNEVEAPVINPMELGVLLQLASCQLDRESAEFVDYFNQLMGS